MTAEPMPTSERPRLVDACGTRRRLEALAALGHTARAIGMAMGRHPDRAAALVRGWRRHDRRVIAACTAAEVAAMYERLRWARGDSPMVRIQSLKAGHTPPQGWDGRDIDDPGAEPRTKSQGGGPPS